MALDLKQVPNTPGIYKFFQNKIIYIGKAKDLKKGYHHISVNLLRIEKHNRLNS